MKNVSKVSVDACAATSAYFALAGIWVVLGLCFIGIGLKSADSGAFGAAAFSLTGGLLWVIWLRGFRLRLTGEQLEYRDGLYRSVVAPLDDIKEVRHTWIHWKLLGSALRVPRLVITHGNRPKGQIAINSKPFRRDDLQRIVRFLQERVAKDPQGEWRN